MTDYGTDWNSPSPSGDILEDCEVVVPETNLPLDEVEIENLQRLIDPLCNSEYHEVDIYAVYLLSLMNVFNKHHRVHFKLTLF